MNGRIVTVAVMLAAVAYLVAAIGARSVPLFIWNASASVPLGLYLVQSGGSVAINDVVVVQPPEPLAAFLADGGYLPRGVPMLKHVLALPGQTVCREGLVLTVDGIAVGEAHERDGRGRPLPVWQGCRPVNAGQLFLMNRSAPDSLDGRYFGPIPETAVIGRVLPAWTDKGN